MSEIKPITTHYMIAVWDKARKARFEHGEKG